MDRVDRLLLFRDVVEKGGFTQAARHRGVAHSTVSRALRELEESLGMPLMTRTTRAASLTEAGEVVLAAARDIGQRSAEMVHALERLETLEGGELRVHALTHVGHALVFAAVQRFSEAHPTVMVRLTLSDGPLHFHRDGLDVALTVGLPAAEQLVVRRLCDNDVRLVAAPSVVAKFGPASAPEDLLHWPVVAYQSEEVTLTRWPYVGPEGIRTVEVRPSLLVSDGVALLEAVRRGAGVGYLSWFSVIEDLRSGRLVEVLPHVELPTYQPVYVVRADLRLVSARVEAFERALREVVASITPR
ncbi:MAG: LysR family transcriptional regulator [Myxococcota bacterium]